MKTMRVKSAAQAVVGGVAMTLAAAGVAYAQSISDSVQNSLDPAVSDLQTTLTWAIGAAAVLALLVGVVWMVVASDKMKVVKFMGLVLLAVALAGLAVQLPAVVQSITGGG